MRRKVSKQARRASGSRSKLPRLKNARFRSIVTRIKRLKSNAKSPRRKLVFLFAGASSLFLAFLVIGSVVGVIMLAVFSRNLPAPDRLFQREMQLSTKIFDRNGELLYDIFGNENRTMVKLDDLPEHVVWATLATEDADFYFHQGFDFIGIVRAGLNIFRGQGLQGGSTISQQLVKNVLLSPERTIIRKIKELVLTLQIEKRYTKDEILQMYLNEVPYGGTAWGIEAASEMYFAKSAKDLTLAEASLLAGMPQRPSYYSPFGAHPERSFERQSYVLHLMQSRGWTDRDGQKKTITETEADDARRQALRFSPSGKDSFKAPHFVMYVKQMLVERYGENMVENGGLQVTTTLDYKMQQIAQDIVAEEIEKAKTLDVGNGGLVAIDPRTGEILVMVGSKDYFAEDYDGNVNVTVSLRQPGSAIKPITYVTAFKQGYTPATMVMDVPTKFPGGDQKDYEPKNYDSKFRGPVILRRALANSINVPAVKVLKLAGVQATINTARDMGISTFTDPDRYGLSLTLGGGEVKLLELTSAFGVFAAEGARHEHFSVLEVKDSKGKILEKYSPSSGKRVLTEAQAYLISDILSDNYARSDTFGLYSPLIVANHTVAAKTGTTDDKRDNWTVGYTPNLVVGVWVGNNDNHPMNKALASGITGAAPIWHASMVAFLENEPDTPFKRPKEIMEKKVDKVSGKLRKDICPEGYTEIFIKGTEPTEKCDIHEEFEICKSDGKLASDLCKDVGDSKKKTYAVYKAVLPEWQKFVDEWIEDEFEDDEREKYSPPTEVSTTYYNSDGDPKDEDNPEVIIKNIDNGDVVGRKFEVEVEVLSPYTVLDVKWYLDGNQIGDEDTSIPYKQEFELGADVAAGEHELKVRASDSGGNNGGKEIIIVIEAIPVT